jgi:hypothetical protein
MKNWFTLFMLGLTVILNNATDCVQNDRIQTLEATAKSCQVVERQSQSVNQPCDCKQEPLP